jgi:hypothetical protein
LVLFGVWIDLVWFRELKWWGGLALTEAAVSEWVCLDFRPLSGLATPQGSGK